MFDFFVDDVIFFDVVIIIFYEVIRERNIYFFVIDIIFCFFLSFEVIYNDLLIIWKLFFKFVYEVFFECFIY